MPSKFCRTADSTECGQVPFSRAPAGPTVGPRADSELPLPNAGSNAGPPRSMRWFSATLRGKFKYDRTYASSPRQHAQSIHTYVVDTVHNVSYSERCCIIISGRPARIQIQHARSESRVFFYLPFYPIADAAHPPKPIRRAPVPEARSQKPEPTCRELMRIPRIRSAV